MSDKILHHLKNNKAWLVDTENPAENFINRNEWEKIRNYATFDNECNKI